MSQELSTRAPAAGAQIPLSSSPFQGNLDPLHTPPPGSESTNKKRKQPKSKIPSEIRRSASTPHIRGLVLAESGASSPAADKRRNKLGYHRTSVACGHCRRRKIRCLLPTPEDPQGRCANCIRLKKECNFYPVDQSAPADLRPPTAVRKDSHSAALSTSAASSPRTPALSNKKSSEESKSSKVQYDQPLQFQSGSDQEAFDSSVNEGMPPRGIQGLHQLTESEAAFPQHFHYPSVEGEGWTSPSFANQPNPQAVASPYWTSAQSTPITGGFPSNSIHTIGQNPSPGYGSPNVTFGQNNHSWPTRSASYSQIEGASQAFPYQDFQNPDSTQPNTLNFSYTSAVGHENTMSLHTTGSQQSNQNIVMSSTSQAMSSYDFQPPWLPFSNPGLVSSSGPDTGQQQQWFAEPAPIIRVDQAHQQSSHQAANQVGQHVDQQFHNMSSFYPHSSHPE